MALDRPRNSSGTGFIGRQREHAQLLAALDDTVQGQGRVVLLAGDAGIGKTRLAQELTLDAATRGVLVSWGRCWEGGGAPAYWPWIQILRSCARQHDGATLAPLLASGTPHLALLAPELRGDQNAPVPPANLFAAVADAEPESEQFRLFDAVATFLTQAARLRPTVLVFDDAHCADTSSLLLLRLLARELQSAPLLLLVTYREIEARNRAGTAALIGEVAREGVTLRLRGFDEADVQRFLVASAGEQSDPSTAMALHRATEGNPFFLSEIVGLLIAEGRLTHTHGDAVAAFHIPEGVRVAIRRRLALVSEATRSLLEIAAVCGRDLDSIVLAKAAGVSLTILTAAIDEAESFAILEHAGPAASQYRFTHALIPETLYEDLPKAQRRALHLRIAETIEEHCGDASEMPLAELAHHFVQALPLAGAGAKATNYAHRGALRARGLLAYEEAAQLYQLAITALELADDADRRLRCELLLGLGEVYYGAGLFDRTREAFERAAVAARELACADLCARAALGFGMPPTTPQFVDRALIQMLEEALALLPESDSSLRARVLARLACELYWSDARVARGGDISNRAVAIARRLGDRPTLIYVLYMRHLAAWSLDNLDERLAIASEIIELAEQDDGRQWEQRVWALRARYKRLVDLLELGDVRAADREIEEYAALAAELRQHLGYEELARATRALMDGRFEESERMAAQALEVARRLQRRVRPFRQAVNSHLLILRREQGRLAEMLPIFEASSQRPRRETLVHCSLAFCYAELNHEAAAGQLEQIALTELASLSRDYGWMAAVILLTDVCTALQDQARAAILYRLLSPYAGRNATLDVHVCYGAVDHYLGKLASVSGERESARRHFEAALASHDAMGAHLWLAHTRYQLAAVLFSGLDPADRERAFELASLAQSAARDLGMVYLTAKIDTLIGPATKAAATPAGTVTILFTDMQGSTKITERLGDLRAQEVIRAHHALTREQLKAYGGFEVKSLGDGFMLAFSSARRALLCASAIQRSFADYNRSDPPAEIRVSMGLHSGEAISEGGDFYGQAVILAARIAATAQPGEILVSATIKQLTESTGDLFFHGERQVALKGFAEPRCVYTLRWDEAAEVPSP